MADNFDLVFKGGTVVTGAGLRREDVAVSGGKVARLAGDIPAAGAGRVIDARGRYLLPGVIDAHVHPVYEDDVEGCSRAAACGGTTTLIHFVYAKKGESLYDATKKMLDDASARSRLDFSLHSAPFDAPEQVGEIERVMRLGVKSFKFFMSYVKLGWNTDDYQLARAMDVLAANGGLAMVHAENGGAIDYLEDKYLTGPKASWKFFNTAHPAALEEEAIFRAVTIAEVTGCPLYIPHNTAARSLIPIRRARAEGRVVYGETCPQYLTLTEEILASRGALAKIGPPIRTAADGEALWAALADNTLQTVASDHAPKKKDPAGDFLKQPYGSPGIEHVLAMTYHEGVNAGRLSLVRLARVLSENPARIFGLYPRKGAIAAGSDADIVVFDPARTAVITAAGQQSAAGYSLYEGRSVLGWPEAVFQRGRPVFENGAIAAEPGRGEFMPTAPEGKFL